MAVITSISVKKAQETRYHIFLDGEYAFSVDEEVLARFQLKKGKSISESEMQMILQEDEIRKGVHLAVQFLSYRMRSKKEIIDYLERKGVGAPFIDGILTKLSAYHYIDDAAYANAYVRTQVQTTKKGPNVIKQELQVKGIHDQQIQQSLTLYKDEQILEHAIYLGEKLVRKHQQLSERSLKQKIQHHLMIKGYSEDQAARALKEIHYQKDEDEEWEALQHHGLKAHKRYRHLEKKEYQMKLKQALYRKGFSFEQIERFIIEVNES